MKKCPYCAEEIQDEAIKCKHCGEFLLKKTQRGKWHHRPYVVLVALLCVGPLALPLLWISPDFKRVTKIVATVLVLVLSYLLTVAFVESLNSLMRSYQQMNDLINM